MAKSNPAFTSFNGGEVGPEIQGRVGIENYGATAALLENWLPVTNGPLGIVGITRPTSFGPIDPTTSPPTATFASLTR